MTLVLKSELTVHNSLASGWSNRRKGNMDTERTEKFLKDHGLTTWGDFSTPPLPYAECDISRFWQMFGGYGIRDIEYRQIRLRGVLNSVRVVIYHDVIFMIGVEWLYEHGKSSFVPHCYIVGCDHSFKVVSDNRGHGISVCTKCGYRAGHDSSD